MVTGAGVTRSFFASQVQKIQVDAAGGSDIVLVDLPKNMYREVTLNGSSGNDLLRGAKYAKNVIIGGSGDDTLIGGFRDDDVIQQ